MLCAFANQNDLRNCLSAVNTALNSDLSDVLIFRAKPRPHAVSDAWIDETEMIPINTDTVNEMDTDDENIEEGTVFALSIKSSDKVRVLRDWRGMSELRKRFPNIDSNVINDIWKQQQCWQACFDVLSSLVKSHGSIIIEQCDLIIDDIHFPALTIYSSLSNVAYPRADDSHQSSRSGSHDWTIVSLEHSFSTMSVSPVDNEGQGIDKWEMIPSPVSTQKAVGFSYKDALLKPAIAITRSDDDHCKKRTWDDLAMEQSSREWKPVFVIAKVSNIRPDRDYLNNNYELDDEEADFYWDLCTNAKFASATSVGAKKVGGVVHMRPAMMEQKLKRIAMKTK